MTTFSNQPLKGMLDDYPWDMEEYKSVRNKIEEVANLFQYKEYDAPVLEPLALFAAKSSEELVREQSYSFNDRGEREVVLRPEMTPSLARMISAVIKEKVRPFRWFSIPKCYRYERPQKGRLREFRQLNFDLIGDNTIYSDLEMFELISELMKRFSVPTSHYVIKWNSRALMQNVFLGAAFSPDEISKAYKLIDRKDKLEPAAFDSFLAEQFPEVAKQLFVKRVIDTKSVDDLIALLPSNDTANALATALSKFSTLVNEKLGKSALFDTSTVRGLDYYTGVVFEVYDTGGKLNRALFGGGRYDNLLSLFGGESVSGIGFGMGIYIFSLFLKEYGLFPAATKEEGVMLIPYSEDQMGALFEAAAKLRAVGVSVETSFQTGAIGKQIKRAEQKGLTSVMIIGDEEAKSRCAKIKNLATGNETEFCF